MTLLGLMLMLQTVALSQTSTIRLDPNQSMCITGKGPGQDGAVNPYLGKKSIAVVENISNNSLQVRIQEGKKVLGIIDVDPDETKEFVLEKNYVLYMDTDRPSAGKVSFKEFEYSK